MKECFEKISFEDVKKTIKGWGFSYAHTHGFSSSFTW